MAETKLTKRDKRLIYMSEYNKRPEVILKKQIDYYTNGPQPKRERRKPLLASMGPGAVIQKRKERIEAIKAEEKAKQPSNVIRIERGDFLITFL